MPLAFGICYTSRIKAKGDEILEVELRGWTWEDKEQLMNICNTVDRSYLSDRLPDPYTEESAEEFRKYCGYKNTEEFFQGFLNKKLVYGILKRLGIRPEIPIRKLPAKDFRNILQMIRRFEIEISGYKGYDMAQITAGGVSTREVVPETLESKKLRGLYFTGELLDVDGTCGGYNLQWAFTSGYIAGRQIGKDDTN